MITDQLYQLDFTNVVVKSLEITSKIELKNTEQTEDTENTEK